MHLARFKLWLVAAILAIIGSVLIIGGATLVSHGGSFYYAVTGLAVVIAAIGVVRRARFAAIAYGAMLVWTIVWALWEAGFEAWALTPRLVAPALLGLVFLAPSV